MMISDGLGPASVSLARSYYQHINGYDYDYLTPLDTIHVGQSRTRSASSLVTDSAAGATAISCGLKTYNRAIGVDPKGNPCGTVLESAKHQHYMKTGLVATSRITHATPASFSAHIKDRDNEDGIAIQQIGDNPLGRSLDLMFGGGYCHFLPKSDKDGCRKDQRHLFNEAKETHNWQTHMAYEIDRDITKEPSLTEMSKKALDLLFDATSDSEKGFFLMIEGSRIDMAGHANDPAAHVHDTLEYERTIALVKEYVEKHPGTIMISTSDHETGGLSLGRSVGEKYPEYKWNPEVLTKVKNSSEVVADLWRKADKNEIATTDYLKENIISNYLGVNDISKEEIDRFMSAKTKKKSLKILATYFSEVVSRRAMIGWTGRGHSGVDVNLYAMGSTTEALRGSHENTDIGKFIANYLDLDLKNITETLQQKK
ncbi:alkaline-phosphatase-like protein [Cunninghamella echinulata]|nr:alkaline-phosphatase-like protein [Cunninghamella echinulata]